jgi:hypothetical protein
MDYCLPGFEGEFKEFRKWKIKRYNSCLQIIDPKIRLEYDDIDLLRA